MTEHDEYNSQLAYNCRLTLTNVDDIKVVINYDFPIQFEDYIHRIGRTGRRGKSGISYTFFNRKNSKSAPQLVKVMEEANQEVSDGLYDLAYIPRSQRRQNFTKPSIPVPQSINFYQPPPQFNGGNNFQPQPDLYTHNGYSDNGAAHHNYY